MKTRCDFVSNSSSASFIIAIDFRKYPFEEFIEQVCRKCCPDKAVGRAEAVDIRRTNEAILRAGMYQECLYYGIPVVGRIRDKWRRGEGWNHMPTDNPEFSPFNIYSAEPPSAESGDTVEIDGDTLTYEYDDELPAWISVPRETMEYGIRKYRQFGKLDDALTKNSVKARAGRIIAYAKQKRDEKIQRYEPEVFCITKNTIQNTRDLIKAGYKVKGFMYPPTPDDELLMTSMDAIEARISAGETFIYAVAGDKGEGRTSNRLYMPNGYSNPFEYTPRADLSETLKL